MTNWYTVVADGRRARFFLVEFPEGLRAAPSITEVQDLGNPGAQVRGDNMLERSPNLAPGGSGPSHTYDDHTERHVEEKALRFSKAISEAIVTLIAERRPTRLILIAEAHTLGRLRKTLNPHLTDGLEVTELAKDLSALSKPEIQEALIRYGVLPTPPRPVDTYHPRGQTTVPAFTTAPTRPVKNANGKLAR